jgi:hypothetical protein
MTDARLPERWLWDRRLGHLKDDEFRSFVQALLWSVGNRTEGRIEPADLALIPGFAPGAQDTLADFGLFTALSRGRGWQITDFALTQTSRAQLDRDDLNRARNRERQARWRAAKAAAEETVPGDVTRDVTRDMTHNDAGQDRTGQDRIKDGYGTKREDSSGDQQCDPWGNPIARNSSERYTPTAKESRLINENVNWGYES